MDTERLQADLQQGIERAKQGAAVTPSAPVSRPGSYDHARRRRSRRTGRQRGCTVDIPAEELAKAGFDPDDPPPFYRVWGSSRGGLFVRLYKEA